MQEIELPITLDDENQIPVYSSALASGADVRAFIETPIDIPSGETTLIPTGIKVER